MNNGMNGKKFVMIFVGVTIICGILTTIWFKNAYDTRPRVQIDTKQKETKRAFDSKIYDVQEKLNGPIDSKVDLKKSLHNNIDSKCVNTFAESASLSLTEFANHYRKNSSFKQCLGLAELGVTPEMQSNIDQACLNNYEEKQCTQALFFVRIRSLAILTEKVPVNQLTEKQIMMRFMAEMTTSGTKNLIALKEMGGELYLRNPQDPQAQDAFFLAEIFPILEGNSQGKVTQEFNEILARTLAERPSDEKLHEYQFVSEMSLPIEERFKAAYDRTMRNPDSATANYNLASIYNKMGDSDAELKLLHRANRLAPGQNRYLVTLQKRLRGENENAYSATFSYGMID